MKHLLSAPRDPPDVEDRAGRQHALERLDEHTGPDCYARLGRRANKVASAMIACSCAQSAKATVETGGNVTASQVPASEAPSTRRAGEARETNIVSLQRPRQAERGSCSPSPFQLQ